jgi:hypothetical protein
MHAEHVHRLTEIQARPAAAAANWVARIAEAVDALAASALPPLKPNQPTHSMAEPTVVIAGFCGGEIRFGKPSRGPMSHAATRADTPAVVWTTMPLAKSIVPIPYPMGNRHIHQHRPNRREQNDETESGALGNGADNQRRSDNRKCHLK